MRVFHHILDDWRVSALGKSLKESWSLVLFPKRKQKGLKLSGYDYIGRGPLNHERRLPYPRASKHAESHSDIFRHQLKVEIYQEVQVR